MKASKSFAIVRSLSIMAAVGVITTGATYAALQSQNASLTNNIINTGSADLRISTNGTTFTTPSTAGFSFDGVVPGGAPAPAAGNSVYLQDYGSANLAIKVAVSGNPSNVSGIDLTKVHLNITRVDIPGATASFALKTLIDSYVNGGTALGDTINAGGTAKYSLKVSMDVDAFSGSSATITGLNIAFMGSGT